MTILRSTNQLGANVVDSCPTFLPGRILCVSTVSQVRNKAWMAIGMFAFVSLRLDAGAGMNRFVWSWPVFLLFIAQSNFGDKLLLAVPAAVPTKVTPILHEAGQAFMEVSQAEVVVVNVVFRADLFHFFFRFPVLRFFHAFFRVVNFTEGTVFHVVFVQVNQRLHILGCY